MSPDLAFKSVDSATPRPISFARVEDLQNTFATQSTRSRQVRRRSNSVSCRRVYRHVNSHRRC